MISWKQRLYLKEIIRISLLKKQLHLKRKYVIILTEIPLAM